MIVNSPKHKTDGVGQYKLQWNHVEKRDEPGIYHYIYWAYFDREEDAKEWYETYVKLGWPDTKWEIIDVYSKVEIS